VLPDTAPPVAGETDRTGKKKKRAKAT
jgi:hypothetical protein